MARNATVEHKLLPAVCTNCLFIDIRPTKNLLTVIVGEPDSIGINTAMFTFSWNHMKSLIPQNHRRKKHQLISDCTVGWNERIAIHSWVKWPHSRPRFLALMGSGRKATSGRTWEVAEHFWWWWMTSPLPRYHYLPSQPTTLNTAESTLSFYAVK